MPRVQIQVEFRPLMDDAPSLLQIVPSRKRKMYAVTKSKEGFDIKINPYPYDEEEYILPLIQALDSSDEIMIGLGNLIEAAFLTGVEIGRKG